MIIRGPFLKCASNYLVGTFAFWPEKVAGLWRNGAPDEAEDKTKSVNVTEKIIMKLKLKYIPPLERRL